MTSALRALIERCAPPHQVALLLSFDWQMGSLVRVVFELGRAYERENQRHIAARSDNV